MKSYCKMWAALLCLFGLYPGVALASVVENLSGAAVNNQGKLSYSVPLDFPASVNGIKPELSVQYVQGAGNGNLGVGFSLHVGSVITRCAPRKQYSDHVGGVETGDRSTYCLDGVQLVNQGGGVYKPITDVKTRLVISGHHAQPGSWQAYSADGYIYHYSKPVSANTAAHTESWQIQRQVDRFGNAINYHYNPSGDQLTHIVYPGFKISIDYDTANTEQKIYSNGVLKTFDNLISSVTLSRNDVDIYHYSFRYDSYSGYKARSSNRLRGIKKCYLINSRECTRELQFSFKPMDGGFISENPASATNILSKDNIVDYYPADSEKSMPAYVQVDFDNRNGMDLCFYTLSDQLVCSMANADGSYSFRKNLSPILFNHEDQFEYYSALNFVDLNQDGLSDLCVADESKVRCVLNRNGEKLEYAGIASDHFNSETGYQFVDINRDARPDLCGTLDDGFYCVLNNGSGGFEDQKLLLYRGFIEREFRVHTELLDENKRKYKNISSQLIDVSGDQIPDLCFVDRFDFVCHTTGYDNQGILKVLSGVYSRTNIYHEVPSNYQRKFINAWTDYDLQKKIKSDFPGIRKTNNRVTLTNRIIDVNSDGLLDLCYDYDGEFSCHLNTEAGFTARQYQADYSAFLAGTNDDTRNAVLSSLHFYDINADGYSDLCFNHNELQYCGYNTGHGFTVPEKRLRIVSDTRILNSSSKVFYNYLRKVLNNHTRFIHNQAVNVYGQPLYLDDLDGDGRGEYCTRTINGIDCYTNEQQSYYALLEEVTEPLGNKLKFEYQTAREVYQVTNSLDLSEGLTRISPVGVLLSAMKTDTGVDQPGSVYETVNYRYHDLLSRPATGESGFRMINQSSDLSAKQQTTVFYTDRHTFGRVKHVTEKMSGSKLSVIKNHYQVKQESGFITTQFLGSDTAVFDPVSGNAIRNNSRRFQDFDQYGYARKIIDEKKSGTDVKRETTDIVFNHNDRLWILGKPQSQSVRHELTGADDQLKSVSFSYYSDTMALKRQTFEEGTRYEKAIDYTYLANGLVDTESVTAYVDADTRQTRSSEYGYNAIGQKVSVKNAYGQQTRVVYHPQCLGPQQEYDISGQLIVDHKYNGHCFRYQSNFSSGDIQKRSITWVHGIGQAPADASHQNLFSYRVEESTESGGYKAEIKDRKGRTIKELSTLAHNATALTQVAKHYYYDNKGLLIAASLPVKVVDESSQAVYWINNNYDALQRKISTTGIGPDGDILTRYIRYKGLTTETEVNGETNKSVVGVNSKVVKKSEYGSTTEYRYTAVGELAATVQNQDDATAITIHYDQYGFKTKQTDPASGTWEYRFNGFGELYWQKDANGNVTASHYDKLGRLTKKTVPEGTYLWKYVTSGFGLGKLETQQSPDGIVRSYQYDALSRLTDEYLNISGTELNRTQYHYDQYGKVEKTIYNKDADDTAASLSVKAGYDLSGRLNKVLVPADKLKSYDYQAIKSQYQSSIEKVYQLDRQLNSINFRIEYHARKIGEYERLARSYRYSAQNIRPNTADIDEMIRKHTDIAARYLNIYNGLIKKSTDYGGADADKRYEYKGYDAATKVHNFAYSECAKTVTRALIFTRCSRYESGAFSISSEDFDRLKESGFKTESQQCRFIHKGHAIPRTSREGIRYRNQYDSFVLDRTYTKPGGRSGPQTYYVYRACKNNVRVKFNVYDIFSQLATIYKTLHEQELEEIARLNALKGEELKEQVDTRVVVNKSITRFVPVAGLYLQPLPVRKIVQVEEVQTKSRQDAINHYTRRQNHFQNQADQHQQEHELLTQQRSDTMEQTASMKEAKQNLLNNLEAFISLDVLQQAADEQQALAGRDLVVWSALNYDATGRVKDELFGNGIVTRRSVNEQNLLIDNITTSKLDGTQLSDTDYIYTAEGNLLVKSDSVRNLREQFSYRDNQLASWSLEVNGIEKVARDYEYDALGNMLQKSDTLNRYQYDSAEDPYRLTSFNGEAIVYDNKGYMTEANGRSYRWASFGKPSSIRYQNRTTQFRYDAAQQRAVKTDSQGTTYYISPEYEQLHKTNGDIVHRFHIKNGYQTVTTIERYQYASRVAENEADTRPRDRVSYYARDMIGSGVLVTGSRGEVVSHRQYTPFGEAVELEALNTLQQLNTDADVAAFINGQKAVLELAQQELDIDAHLLGQVLTVSSVVNNLKGFTSHEELADVGLVHMNARIYDPQIGRFVSPDSIIPDAGKPLAYNRYAYVYNNPGLAADPTGHWVWYALAYYALAHSYSDSQFHHVASTVMLAIATGKTFPTYSPAVVAGGTSLVSSAALSGRIGQTEIRAAAFAAIAAQAAHTIGYGNNGGPLFEGDYATALAHGLSQGTIGWVQHKNFWQGFVSGSVSHISGVYAGKHFPGSNAYFARSAIAVTTAALLSKATGGDAMQSAMTAVIVHLFNFERGVDDSPGELRVEISRSFDGTSGTATIYEGDEVIYSGEVFNREQADITDSNRDPYSSNHQIPDGEYTMTRRLCVDCKQQKYKDHPAFSNTKVPGRILSPFGSVRTSILWHNGSRPSHSAGCFVSPDFNKTIRPLLESYDQYVNGAVSVTIYTNDF